MPLLLFHRGTWTNVGNGSHLLLLLITLSCSYFFFTSSCVEVVFSACMYACSTQNARTHVEDGEYATSIYPQVNGSHFVIVEQSQFQRRVIAALSSMSSSINVHHITPTACPLPAHLALVLSISVFNGPPHITSHVDLCPLMIMLPFPLSFPLPVVLSFPPRHCLSLHTHSGARDGIGNGVLSPGGTLILCVEAQSGCPCDMYASGMEVSL